MNNSTLLVRLRHDEVLADLLDKPRISRSKSAQELGDDVFEVRLQGDEPDVDTVALQLTLAMHRAGESDRAAVLVSPPRSYSSRRQPEVVIWRSYFRIAEMTDEIDPGSGEQDEVQLDDIHGLYFYPNREPQSGDRVIVLVDSWVGFDCWLEERGDRYSVVRFVPSDKPDRDPKTARTRNHNVVVLAENFGG